MIYLTAVAAAERLKRSEKTVRRWITEGKLPAHHVAKNRYAIAEPDVERLANELAQFESHAEQTPDLDRLAARMSELEQKIAQLELLLSRPRRDIDSIEQLLVSEPSVSRPRREQRQKAATEPQSSSKEPPASGALLAKDFATIYGVNASTFRDHVRKGIGPESEKAPSTSRQKPGRPNEREYWILPEQQQQVLNFWDKYGVRYTVPEQQQESEDQR